MSHFSGISHRFISQSAPSCELASWSVNRTVNKLMQSENTKYGDHPAPFLQLSDSEVKHHEFTCDLLTVPHAFGQKEIPLLMKTIRDSGHSLNGFRALKHLDDAIKDPERAQVALQGGLATLLTQLLDSRSQRIILQSLRVIETLADQPQGRMVVVRNEKLMSKIMSCFDFDLPVVRIASAALLALSSNYIAVEELLKAGCMQLLLRKLTQLSASFETCVSEDTTLVNMLNTLMNLTDLKREAKLDAIIHGALDLRQLSTHPTPAVRTALAEFLSLLALEDASIQRMSTHNMKETLLRNFKRSSQENTNDLSAFVSKLMFSSIRSKERRSFANYEIVNELFSILVRDGSPKLTVLQLLTNLAEVQETRSTIEEQLKLCFPKLARHGGDDVMAAVDNLKLVLEKEA